MATHQTRAGWAARTPQSDNVLDLSTAVADAKTNPPGDLQVTNPGNCTSAAVASSTLSIVHATATSTAQRTSGGTGYTGPRFEWRATPVQGVPLALTGRFRISAGGTQNFVVAGLYLGADEDNPGVNGTGSNNAMWAGMGRNYLGTGGLEDLAARISNTLGSAEANGDTNGGAAPLTDFRWFRILVDSIRQTVTLLTNPSTATTEPTSGWVEMPGTLRNIAPGMLNGGTIRAGIVMATYAAVTFTVELTYLRLTGATVL